ncbi:MAG: LamB/YcsF family protein [Chloroflexi bacterium]|nr:LamB/YcsF family protein [Chloroflexota bacterium]
MSPRTIDVNADVGESFGRWTLGEDEALIPLLSSANVACGFHAGDPTVIDETVARCARYQVVVGAQPGYPDLQGFGRRAMALTPREVEQAVLYQIGAVAAFCRAHGVSLGYVKPHGALYHAAAGEAAIAAAIARAVRRFQPGLALVGPAGSVTFAAAAAQEGLPFIPEAFADRRYLPDGTLQPRSVVGSLITDPAEAAQQALSIARDGVVTAVDGQPIALSARTLCFHGDTPGAPAIVRAARTLLEAHGITIRAFAGAE